MTALRRTAAPALAAAILGLLLGGCGSHKDSGPQLHGAGGNQNEPSPPAMTDSGNHSGLTTSGGGINGTPTPDAASNPEFGGGAAGSSVATRATPDSGVGMVPGASSDSGGTGQIFPTAAPPG
jgi:hypothetical protein